MSRWANKHDHKPETIYEKYGYIFHPVVPGLNTSIAGPIYSRQILYHKVKKTSPSILLNKISRTEHQLVDHQLTVIYLSKITFLGK